MGAPQAVEATISLPDLERLAKIVKADAGIHLTEEKRSLICSRLTKRLRALNLTGFAAYCDFITSEDGSAERKEMLSALTTNVTRFFREEHHFKELREEVAPLLLAAAQKRTRIRIWSAGCSTGEEPYTIAMTLLEAAPDLAKADFRVLATDIDPKVLATASAGVYQQRLLDGVPDSLRMRWFDQTDEPGTLQANEQLRRLITFKKLNLIEKWPLKGPFDAIFCRNVLIYFEQETQDAVIGAFAKVMPAGARLFLGHSERIGPKLTGAFERSGLTSYRRTEVL